MLCIVTLSVEYPAPPMNTPAANPCLWACQSSWHSVHDRVCLHQSWGVACSWKDIPWPCAQVTSGRAVGLLPRLGPLVQPLPILEAAAIRRPGTTASATAQGIRPPPPSRRPPPSSILAASNGATPLSKVVQSRLLPPGMTQRPPPSAARGPPAPRSGGVRGQGGSAPRRAVVLGGRTRGSRETGGGGGRGEARTAAHRKARP
jgi:hypothetical protein